VPAAWPASRKLQALTALMSDSQRDDVPAVPRRRFLSTLATVPVVIAAAAASIPAVVYAWGSIFEHEPEVWRDVGPVDGFQIGSTVEVVFDAPAAQEWVGVSERMGAWLRRVSETEFVAFSINCTHLGCPVRWLQDAKLFMCPCHGGVFYADGSVAAGPPEQPLRHHRVRVSGGRVQLLTIPVPIIG
jgi:menaquinol-cytochrome c reductase iron-sulfur subunit